MENIQSIPTINNNQGIFLIKKSWLPLVFIILFPFIVALPRGTPIPLFKLDEVIVILFFLILAINKNYIITKIDFALILLFLSGTLIPIMGIVSRRQTIEWIEFIALLKPYFIYRIILMGLENRGKLSQAIYFLLLPSIIIAALAFLQLVDIFGVRSFLADIYSESSATALVLSSPSRLTLFRATSTLGQWNTLGGYAALGACLCFAFVQHRKALRFSWLAPLFFVVNLILLSLAGSSSSIIGLLVGLAYLYLVRPKKLKFNNQYFLIIFLILLLGSIIFLPAGQRVLSIQIERQSREYIFDRITGSYYPTFGVPASVVTRWLLAKHLFGLMLEDGKALLTGFGSGSVARGLLPWGSPESGYVGMYFFYGFFFLVAYFFLLFILMRISRGAMHIAKNDELGLALSRGASSLVIVMFVINFIGSYYVAAGVVHYFWITFGLVAAYLKIHHKTSMNFDC